MPKESPQDLSQQTLGENHEAWDIVWLRQRGVGSSWPFCTRNSSLQRLGEVAAVASGSHQQILSFKRSRVGSIVFSGAKNRCNSTGLEVQSPHEDSNPPMISVTPRIFFLQLLWISVHSWDPLISTVEVFYDLQRQLKLQLPGVQILAVPQRMEDEFLGQELWSSFFIWFLTSLDDRMVVFRI